MSEDDEILQDFVVEAGEILEQLSEQLVDLERSPEDDALLNAIFRGFHTVKGGAGFLQFDAMVDLCHVAENVFDLLRKGECKVTPDIMDTVLRALDSVNVMFDEIRKGESLTAADQGLLKNLARIADGEVPISESEAIAATEPLKSVSEPTLKEPVAGNQQIEAPLFETGAGSDDPMTDDEFEKLLDALESDKVAAANVSPEPVASDDSIAEAVEPPLSSAQSTDEITEEEFDLLLNQIAEEKKRSARPLPIPAQPIEAGKPLVSSKAGKLASAAEPSQLSNQLSRQQPGQQPKSASANKTGKETASTEATVRVDTRRLDDIMNMVGELVLVRNRLVRLGVNSQDEEMNKAVSNLDVVTADLQTSVMKTRMQPIKKVFGRFPRVVRDLARNLKKDIQLELMGEDTDLDKNLVEALADPLVHLVRNSVDHGIELPDVREAAGKPRSGTIILSAEQEGDHILLTIQDDGKGMDPEALKAVAIGKGLLDVDAADRLSEAECFNLIFAPGFSSREVISDVSGRGVGMDVVKTKISQLNGTVDIESQIGEGSRIIIKVPLTLAIMPTLMVMLADQTFALPLVSVNEIFHLDLGETNVVDGQEVIIVRNRAIPLYYLKRWLVPRATFEKIKAGQVESHVVIVSVGSQKVGFVVDQLIGQEEVVIKPLGRMLHGTEGMAGATITGDGTIALILDVPGMLKRYG